MGLFGGISGQDLRERDPKAARESFEAFKELVTRFPDSRYTPDAMARMRYLVNAMAINEVRIAEYYLRRQAYVAAVNRAQFVLANYQQSPTVEQALIVLVKAYEAMGLTELRDDTARLLKLNFPKTQVLPESGAAQEGLVADVLGALSSLNNSRGRLCLDADSV